jgi:acyl-coenzyme A thioesterase PaaI-like protein
MSTETRISPAGGFSAVFGEVDPAAPDYEKLRAVADDMVPFGVHAGLSITEIGPERAVVEIPAEPHLTNHMRTVHAGALFLAADIAGAAAFVGAVAPRLAAIEMLVLKDARAAFRKPALGRIRAVATVDEREMRRILAAAAGRRFEIDGKAQLFDDNDVLVARFGFDYVCTLAAEG